MFYTVISFIQPYPAYLAHQQSHYVLNLTLPPIQAEGCRGTLQAGQGEGHLQRQAQTSLRDCKCVCVWGPPWTLIGLHKLVSIIYNRNLKGAMTATRCGVINRYKPFWKSAPYDITGVCVHLDV